MADFEIRKGGMVLAATSGPKDVAYRDAVHYYWQYVEEATEEEPVELVELHVLMTTDARQAWAVASKEEKSN
ncbi:hypothetical protein [Caballeronia sp. INDeC2]|uniref:hypothetical protein n=1 Tax=Caballeronia sp. INDeC2 TaxID=2921747 RepID=UPI0020282690|nr:hypothetical protein [Caballeronia sp. INDeC2]